MAYKDKIFKKASDQISCRFILWHSATKAQPTRSRREAQPSGHVGSTPQSMPESSAQGKAESWPLTADRGRL